MAERRVVAGDGVAVVLLGLAHDALGHLRDLGHEGVALQAAVLHLGQLVLPVAGQLGLGQVFHAQAAQQRHQLEGLGGGHQFAALAVHVLLVDQAFDDGGARGRRAQALLGHGLAQFVVVDQLAGAFHRRQQRGFGVARRRLGLQRHRRRRFRCAPSRPAPPPPGWRRPPAPPCRTPPASPA